MSEGLSRALKGAWLPSCLTGLITWLCLLQALYPSLHWYDTGEWSAAPRMLSLAHPPGHPLTVLSTHVIQLLPWLDGYGRANLASALWLSLASALTCRAALSLFEERARAPSYEGLRASLSAVIIGLYLPALPLAWLQGVRAEVYAAQCALAALSLCAWAGYRQRQDLRWLLIGGLSIGLQLSNHTLLAVAVTAPYLAWLMCLRFQGRVTLKGLALITLMTLGGLSLYAHVWLRGQAGGLEGWGWVSDASSLWDTVSAQVWRRSVIERSAEISLLDNIARLSAFMIQQLGALSALLAFALTLLATLRWSRARRWGAPLTLAALCVSVALTKLTYPFLEVNPDLSGYLAAGAPSLCLLIGLACLEVSPRLAPLLIGALALGAATQPRAHGDPRSYGAEAWVRALSEEVPPRGALWSAHYATHFGLTALRSVEGWRPDLGLVFRGHRGEPWFKRRLARASEPQSPARFLSLGPRVRLEVEGELDVLPELRSAARAQGLTWGLSPWTRAASLAELRRRLTLVKLRGNIGERAGIDSVYAMALYHEAHLQWLKRGPNALAGEALEPLIELHRSERDRWLETLP